MAMQDQVSFCPAAGSPRALEGLGCKGVMHTARYTEEDARNTSAGEQASNISLNRCLPQRAQEQRRDCCRAEDQWQ